MTWRTTFVGLYIKAGDWPALRAADQLNRECRRGAALHGFQEVDLAFVPTFKRNDKLKKYQAPPEPGTVAYFSRKRVPSWCDRVLYRSLPAGAGAEYTADAGAEAGGAGGVRQSQELVWATAGFGCSITRRVTDLRPVTMHRCTPPVRHGGYWEHALHRR